MKVLFPTLIFALAGPSLLAAEFEEIFAGDSLLVYGLPFAIKRPAR